MITPPGIPGVVFGTRADGDARSDGRARDTISTHFEIPRDWATIRQVHGSVVAYADAPGFYGDADGLVTDVPGLPIAIATADCVPVVLISQRSRAVVHAGWRGVAAGAVPEAVDVMHRAGNPVERAVIGPHIGPCCYEVGQEVVDAIGGFAAKTRAGRTSVDLGLAIRTQLDTIETVDMGICTFEDGSMASYRQDRTSDRQVTVAWLPQA
ncbi:MAG: polyphenol oxidase family protein [Actinomycetota bacterium]